MYFIRYSQPMDILWLRNFYSMLLLKIRTVKRDFNDYTLTVPLAINGIVAVKPF